MENRTNQIMSLDNGRDYFINRQILYKGNTYYVATLLKEELDEDGTRNPDDEVVIFHQTMENGQEEVRVLNDKEVAKTILENL